MHLTRIFKPTTDKTAPQAADTTTKNHEFLLFKDFNYKPRGGIPFSPDTTSSPPSPCSHFSTSEKCPNYHDVRNHHESSMKTSASRLLATGVSQYPQTTGWVMWHFPTSPSTVRHGLQKNSAPNRPTGVVSIATTGRPSFDSRSARTKISKTMSIFAPTPAPYSVFKT